MDTSTTQGSWDYDIKSGPLWDLVYGAYTSNTIGKAVSDIGGTLESINYAQVQTDYYAEGSGFWAQQKSLDIQLNLGQFTAVGIGYTQTIQVKFGISTSYNFGMSTVATAQASGISSVSYSNPLSIVNWTNSLLESYGKAPL